MSDTLSTAQKRRQAYFIRRDTRPFAPRRSPPRAIMVLRTAIFLCGFSAVLCVVSIAYGGASGLPESIREVGFSECASPCYMGVLPGITPWADAHAALTLRGAMMDSNLARINFGTRSDTTFRASVDGENAGAMYVFLPPGKFSVGWMLDLYGEPCGASIYPRARVITLRYATMLANIAVETHFSAYTSVTALMFADPASPHEVIWSQCRDNVTDAVVNVDWRGLLPLQRVSRFFID